MADTSQTNKSSPPPRRYKWPWFVLAAFLAAIVLAIIWLSFEINRTRRIRELNTPGQLG